MSATVGHLRFNRSCQSTPSSSPQRLPLARSCENDLGPRYAEPEADEVCPISLSSSACPIPATDWRPQAQAEEALGGSPDLAPTIHHGWVERQTRSRGASPLVRTSSDNGSVSDPEREPSSKSSRRRSMSSLGMSASEALSHQHFAEALQHEERRTAAIAATASPSRFLQSHALPADLPPEALHARDLAAAVSATPPNVAYPEYPSDAPLGADGDGATKLPSPANVAKSQSESAAATGDGSCMNWDAVEELCASMDAAGLQLEDIDILCLTPSAQGSSVRPPQAPAGPGAGEDPSKKTLLSLKFSHMTLRHYPGDDKAKQMFHEALSR